MIKGVASLPGEKKAYVFLRQMSVLPNDRLFSVDEELEVLFGISAGDGDELQEQLQPVLDLGTNDLLVVFSLFKDR